MLDGTKAITKLILKISREDYVGFVTSGILFFRLPRQLVSMRFQVMNLFGIRSVIFLFSSTGWFRILPEDRQHQSLIVPLTSIERVVASKSTRFLVHSSVTGLWPSESPSMTMTSKRDSFLSIQAPPGEVLTCGPIFVEPEDNTLNTMSCCLCSVFGKKTETTESGRMYLQCRGTSTGMNILLPLETYGQFSCIGTIQPNGDDNPANTSQPPTVYQVKDLVNGKDFPQAVHLVYGTPPPTGTNSQFTGLMALGKTYSEQSIIACQIAKGGDRLAFVEFPDDSGVEFLLANYNWGGDASVLKAIAFCRENSDSYKLEIQPVVEGVRLHETADDVASRDSANAFVRGTYRKRSFDKRILRHSNYSESAIGDPTSRQRSSERPQSGETVPTIPQRGTKMPTGFKRRQASSHTPQGATAIPAAARPRSAHSSSAFRRHTQSVDHVLRTSTVLKVLAANLTQRAQDAPPASLPNSPENDDVFSVVSQTPARFTKSLERHRLTKKAIALVHTPRPTKGRPPSKSEVNQTPNITRSSSGRMTYRKLPPLPSQTDPTKNIGESNHGFQGTSSEVESCNSSDPERLYDRIPCQKEISNEPSPSAPSSPAPTIRHRQETPAAPISPLAYDQDGYLTPVSLRTAAHVSETGRERISFSSPFRNTGYYQKSGHTFYSSYRRYNASQTDRIPLSRNYDSERLQSFLNDSVAELYRKQSNGSEDREKTTEENNNQHLDEKINYSDDVSTIRKRARSLSAPDFSNHAYRRDEVDGDPEAMIDCECGDIDREDDFSLTFLHRISSTSLRAGRHNPAGAVASYPRGFDPAAFSDSGIASRQSTMRNENRVYWKALEMSWTPPEDLSSLTVEEVSMALRYIGMKDHIAVSFSKELVDGKLLCEMNSHLLREGFPNMNSLERKKVLDFVRGWRPKRLLFI